MLAEGRNDPERLVRGELLYTGALRTPICAIVQRVPLWGGWCPVAAEFFATAQDVHLVLGCLPAEQCTSLSADGRPMLRPTTLASGAVSIVAPAVAVALLLSEQDYV